VLAKKFHGIVREKNRKGPANGWRKGKKLKRGKIPKPLKRDDTGEK